MLFRSDAKEYGSILNVESYNWELLRRFVAAEDTAGQISMDSVGDVYKRQGWISG